ncbi:5-formyltetrahydrofolate cyclo-ligase [Robertkochia solimangrovi]|uniref:5-formyltetrahydrofolate cyclo-ligase n=1 Tax=Robertkochia solimangrovi TaxID=2213046 RepID=UPI00117E1D7E|nr:5-formyltetrahydrofolate cyclo-ligase [Robertkochia solimangrovi]TRZ45848.1 5-formyltetrahydrofolate cyclo-ligase [Robertkochia solimangrovi]
MEKARLRSLYKKLRNELGSDEIESKSISIANQALKMDIWNHNCYHIFLSIEQQKEIDTSFLLSILQGKDKDITVSRSDFKTGELEHILLTDNTKISINNYGIPEPVNGIAISPENIDVVFIPLLAYDEHGNRIGYGKGFYDRFLSKCKANTKKIGLSFFPPEHKITDIHEGDIRLDACITPEAIYYFEV